MHVPVSFILAFLATMAVMIAVAVYSTRKVQSATDFSLAGRNANSFHVAGGILGTLVGGAATIGTVQLAYNFGLSAWWFTCGCSIACLFLGVSMAPSLRRGMVETIPQFISRYHGERARVCASIFSACGMFIHIVAQLLAAGALLSTLFNISMISAAAIAVTLTIIFAVGGGMNSAGPLGLIKLLLIYTSMTASGLLAYSLSSGLSGIQSSFPPYPWFSFFGYGVSNGLSDFFSVVVGVLSTQTYLQSIFAARDVKSARNGALISAAVMLPLGFIGIIIGLYMRISAPGIESAKALPLFISLHFSPLFAGIAFAALLITAIGTAAGLATGVGTTLVVDVISKIKQAAQHKLLLMRLMTALALLAAFILLVYNVNSAIMEWSFLSMGLRGATICLPLLLAIFLRDRTSRAGGAISIFTAPTVVIISGILSTQFTPLYAGLCVSLFAILFGYAYSLAKERKGIH